MPSLSLTIVPVLTRINFIDDCDAVLCFQLRHVIDLLGPPPEHLVRTGIRVPLFFKKTESDEWILKVQYLFSGLFYFYLIINLP